MAQNQSIFDPIFWVHHCNIERYLCSWQRLWPCSPPPTPDPSRPPDSVMETVMYPWTKPADVAAGHLSWMTSPPGTEDSHGTFAEWFNAFKTSGGLSYKFDEYYIPTVPLGTVTLLSTALTKVRIQATLSKKLRGDEFHLYRHEKRIATLSVLSAVGTGCARCNSDKPYLIDFDVSHDDTSAGTGWETGLELKINGDIVRVQSWTVSKF
jgi:hypothetical protein